MGEGVRELFQTLVERVRVRTFLAALVPTLLCIASVYRLMFVQEGIGQLESVVLFGTLLAAFFAIPLAVLGFYLLKVESSFQWSFTGRGLGLGVVPQDLRGMYALVRGHVYNDRSGTWKRIAWISLLVVGVGCYFALWSSLTSLAGILLEVLWLASFAFLVWNLVHLNRTLTFLHTTAEKWKLPVSVPRPVGRMSDWSMLMPGLNLGLPWGPVKDPSSEAPSKGAVPAPPSSEDPDLLLSALSTRIRQWSNRFESEEQVIWRWGLPLVFVSFTVNLAGFFTLQLSLERGLLPSNWTFVGLWSCLWAVANVVVTIPLYRRIQERFRRILGDLPEVPPRGSEGEFSTLRDDLDSLHAKLRATEARQGSVQMLRLLPILVIDYLLWTYGFRPAGPSVFLFLLPLAVFYNVWSLLVVSRVSFGYLRQNWRRLAALDADLLRLENEFWTRF